jgi:D-alanyl-D-alanine carboxypeptidase/D-alanyl-D-alanine-endopeptidase (penicillin-binding protein 4)
MRKPIRFILYVAALILLWSGTVPTRLQTEINALNGDEALKHGIWGLCVVGMDSGNVIGSNLPDKSVIPASTLKVLTTGAAMGMLGKDYRYTTFIEYDGEFDKTTGVISGNLYIRGTGDPTLESAAFPMRGDTISTFQSLGIRLKRMGVNKINGNIIGDQSLFSDNPLPDGWSWGDLGQYYGAGTSGLGYKDNKVVLHYNTLKGDTAKLISVVPLPKNVVYHSFVTCEGAKDEAYVYGAPFGNDFRIYGSIPKGKSDYEVEAAHPLPALQCAEDLKRILTSVGINCGEARIYNQEDKARDKTVRKQLTTLTSPKLSEIIVHVNKKSDNVYAEQLLRTLGAVKGSGGTTEAGTAVVKSYWQSQGVDVSGMNLTDGSGLSRSNLVTTRQMATILYKISKMSWFAEFDASLPVAGKEGSMTSLCKGTCAENNLRAKTGYINRARGYAGYVKTKGGRLVAFSLLANNYTCTPTEMKKKLEKVMVGVAEME